jgi:multimeric flavodoxin WrbA
MRVAVIFGSQRQGGTHSKIEDMIDGLNIPHEFDFIKMSEIKIEGCVDCKECSRTGVCILPSGKNDMFHNVFDRLKNADVILIVTPVYAPIPSRLVAMFERLLSVSYYSNEIGKLERPLKNKKTAIVSYDSGKIGDETPIKIIFQKFLMDNYDFFNVNYNYINIEINPNEKYLNVIEYVKHIVLNL